ncbi:4-diphosphocytidyl-2-C-methyl-D-erythritol kinase [Loktanella ponticola]|uniref:4-diphosphocytidyl-2-C-methyl-D-erythritol kinase n=1 Tax=Yoonia ponticola TaxID=1524255 RepID=A0A7W9EYQ3_9RHOB|nr:4-(cytidine 5'-diphospho)-2-C-methyl-D-erythritol kinase [Yoonia ponticola]MBB5723053.1 4-diphosphocytidyl-2-C-methyl-D-erythritol kinase [Yoonia ponticola]
MASIKAVAPAKVNLTLHVTGQRDDGYHLLDSLVVFTDAGDIITASPSNDLTLTVNGPFAAGVPTDKTNLILRAAETLRRMRGVIKGAAITVEKHLPNAAGLGGGSSDAATTLKLLAELWDVAPLPASAAEVVMLGADVPVCLRAPAPTHMTGIGDQLASTAKLPECALILVNPKIAVPTDAVFKGLATKQNPPMDPLPQNLSFADFSEWLAKQRNDLQAPAIKTTPAVQSALDLLIKNPAVTFAGMSGSGATCFGLTKNMAAARQAARVIQVAQMGWWVTPAEVLRG